MECWDIVNDEDINKTMRDIMIEFATRNKDGASTSSLATFLVAKAKTANNNLKLENTAQLFEVIGLMFRGGYGVIERIQESYSDPAIDNMTMTILQTNNMLRKIRREYGAGSVTEIEAMRAAFNLD